MLTYSVGSVGSVGYSGVVLGSRGSVVRLAVGVVPPMVPAVVSTPITGGISACCSEEEEKRRMKYS